VDRAVRQAREMRSAAAAGFVNGVLRRIARTGGEVAYPDPGRDPAAYLAAYASLPAWIAQRWVARLGLPEATDLALACNATPAIGYTSNILKGSAEEARRALEADLGPIESGRWVPATFRGAAGVGSPGESRAVREGLAFVMDEAAVLPVYLLGLAPGQRMLDACAGGGGKAAVAAGMLRGEGMIVALEPQDRALHRLREACARLGLDCVHPVQAEAQRAGAILRDGPEGVFDAVLVDAPCTGLGTLRRHPEIKWRIAPDDVGRLGALQRDILAGAAPCVRPGGVLAYATCTTESEENEDVVEAFLASHPDFHVEDAGPYLPAQAAGLAAKGYLRTWPHRHGIDGFFAARLRRGSGSGGQGSGTRTR
jgi:16S rRNA (cytosine967-C5)-methyltransferase